MDTERFEIAALKNPLVCVLLGDIFYSFLFFIGSGVALNSLRCG